MSFFKSRDYPFTSKDNLQKCHLEHILRVLGEPESTEMDIGEVREIHAVSRGSGEELYNIDQLTAMH